MKSVLITGTAQGLGLELVKACLKNDYQVFAISRRISDELNCLKGDNCHIFECDVQDYERLQQVKSEVLKYTSSIDVIFNNAGVWLDNERRMLEDEKFDFSLFTKQYEINAVAPLKVVKTFIDMVLNSDDKCIINLSSEAGSIENCWRDCEYGYSMSKSALNMATRILQNAYPSVKSYAIHPGWMRTAQGFLGATGPAKPDQEPFDTAEKLIKLSKSQTKDFIFGDFNGNKMPW
jgi:NAD(P)-dependent dehydrogenase (short-subunit alcohol dehydrogenase family)